MSASFAVVICHGSYHTPEPYRTFIDALSDQNIKAYCPQLPSSDLSKLNIGDASNPDYDHEPPAGGYPQQAEDIVIVKELLTDLIEARNENVLLIGHSSGTVTATASATPELQQKSRAAKGKKGGVVGIFYECGFLVPPGESLHSFFQPKDGGEAVIPPFTVVHVSFSFMVFELSCGSKSSHLARNSRAGRGNFLLIRGLLNDRNVDSRASSQPRKGQSISSMTCHPIPLNVTRPA